MGFDIFKLDVSRQVNFSQVKIVVERGNLDLSKQWTVTNVQLLEVLQLSEGVWPDYTKFVST